jgi:deoxyribodipyrimidine photo-lyase
MVPDSRIRAVNTRGVRPAGGHVLYWMVAHRRITSNFALERAAHLAGELGRPLVIFEPLRVDYPWASDRLHRFVIDGMADNARALGRRPVTYLAHVERARGEGRALLAALARDAAVVVTDDYPAFFLPQMIERAGQWLDVRLEAVDSNGLLPIRSHDRPFATAFAFRAMMQRTIRPHLGAWPTPIDWDRLPAPRNLDLPAGTPPATPAGVLDDPDHLIAALPIDHSVPPALVRGGARAGTSALNRFITTRLARYADDHNHPDLAGTSGLSPYLRFGHLAAHDVFAAVMTAEAWTSRRLAPSGGGKREGWWGVSPSAEDFLDQLVTWRELGFATCAAEPHGYDTLEGLPAWARRTLDLHAADARPVTYTRDQLESAATHDRIWNAAQRQLTRDGWMHNYLRMLWGKKILEWTATPAEALETMIQIMNRHALDGRDPNSYTGYSWTLGRYDRPWAPERPIFGTVRYMSSDNTFRKLKMKTYLAQYGV